jgi:hypothetical protein
MAFLILHIALSGRFSFGSRHGHRPSGPRATTLALLAFWYRDFLPTRHSAGNECAQFRLILSQFNTLTPYIPLDHCPPNLKEVYIRSDWTHSKSSGDMVSIHHHCRSYTPLVLSTWPEVCMSNTAKGRQHVACRIGGYRRLKGPNTLFSHLLPSPKPACISRPFIVHIMLTQSYMIFRTPALSGLSVARVETRMLQW